MQRPVIPHDERRHPAARITHEPSWPRPLTVDPLVRAVVRDVLDDVHCTDDTLLFAVRYTGS